jgi:hypothetical protein
VEGTAGTREFIALLYSGMLAVGQAPHQQWSWTALMTNSWKDIAVSESIHNINHKILRLVA